ncbi:MAG: ORF6N domain-containing protein [Betaproteobacteria bacterium]|nr:MAG: ORF6N domain-containing protein [Betaproteobacteria bacterium]
MGGRKAEAGAIVVPIERITQSILLIRGHKVILDEDLADLYQVETKALNRAVRRNRDRFPDDFMFQLRAAEFASLRYQSGTSNLRSQIGTSRWGGRRYAPYAFTEQGVAMLSSVLRSKRAVMVNVEIMRAFVRLRQLLASNAELARKLAALEKKYDSQFREVFEAIRELMAPPTVGKRPIGFGSWGEGK